MKASVDDIRIIMSAVITANVKVGDQEEIEKPEDEFRHDKDVPSMSADLTYSSERCQTVFSIFCIRLKSESIREKREEKVRAMRKEGDVDFPHPSLLTRWRGYVTYHRVIYTQSLANPVRFGHNMATTVLLGKVWRMG